MKEQERRARLFGAVEADDAEAVERLVAKDADIEAREETPEGSDIVEGPTPLGLAIREKKWQAADALLAAETDAAAEMGRSRPAHERFFYEWGYFATKPLISVYVGQQPPEDVLPLLQKHPALREAVLKEALTYSGANEDLMLCLLPDTNKETRTRLFLAAAGGRYTRSVDWLLRNGADKRARDRDGYTALHLAARFDFPDTLLLLLTAGCDPNKGDKEGWRPLHLAAFFDVVPAVRLLLQHGANPLARDNTGSTPYYWAKPNTKPLLQAVTPWWARLLR